MEELRIEMKVANLVKRPNDCWTIVTTSPSESFPFTFDTIEKAADAMLDLGVSNDEIDSALIHMYAYSRPEQTVWAIFTDNKFAILDFEN
jgi:hypothetical protein